MSTKITDFLIKEKLKALDLAESLAYEYGDREWFICSYTSNREYKNISESIKTALEQQNLWEMFESKVDKLYNV